VKQADLYIFSLVTGETFYYSGFQTPLVAPLASTTTPLYSFSLGPRFKRSKIKTQVGPTIDELDVEVFAGASDILSFAAGGTLTWQQAFHLGLFDGAYCELLRCYISYSAPTYFVPTVEGTVTRFYGRVGDIEIGRTSSKMKVKSLLDLLTVQMPRRLFQSACNHKFGEPGTGMCGYDRINGVNALGVATGIGQVNFTCGTGSNQNSLTAGGFTPTPSTAYDNGTIIGATGLNAGYTRTVGKVITGSPTVIYYLKPWAFTVIAGTDTFNILPGCDRTLETCTGTFQNQLRFGGFPYIPPPESAV
jgi:hypothetical protein